jgi:hypothetical protein
VTRKNSLPLQEAGDDQEAHTCNTCIMTALMSTGKKLEKRMRRMQQFCLNLQLGSWRSSTEEDGEK